MRPPDIGARLRDAGLRPTIGRQTVLGLMLNAEGQPRCCEDLYRLAMASRRSLNVSSIAHALSDLERVGLVVRVSTTGERRLYYRAPMSAAQVNLPRVELVRDGGCEPVGDTRAAQWLQQWLTLLGIPTDEQSRIVIAVERLPS